MIEFIISIWLILVLVLSFYKIKWGVALYLAYMILVPVTFLSIGGLSFGQNVFKIIFLFIYFVYAKLHHYKLFWKPLLPFFVYYGLTLIIMPFQTGVPFGVMIDGWRVDAMSTLILPFVMWNLIRNDKTCVTLFRNTMLASISIAVLYGLFVMSTKGVNLYIMSLQNIIDLDVNYFEQYYSAEGSGRIFGRISSVFVHPMSYGLFLGLSLVYLFQLRNTLNKTILIVLLISIGVSVITCGVRTVILAVAVTIAYYLFKSGNIKLMVFVIVMIPVSIFALQSMPELSAYLGSIFDANNAKGDVSGSSLSMRLEQLQGAISEAGKNPIFGLGYGWTGYYKKMHSVHPICLSFESLIFVIICNWGIMGFVIWGGFIYLYLWTNRKMKLKDVYLFHGFLVFYLVYSCVTGEYGYMQYFLLFYILMIGNVLDDKRIKNKLILKQVNNKEEKKQKNGKHETTNNSILSSSVPSVQRK